jgi:hypothetical protein
VKNLAINNILPVDIVLAPEWWAKHEKISFDEDFFYHPLKRVEVERQMEQVLYERWGQFGMGADRDKDLPQIGPVHLAAGYMISEMFGCQVNYNASTPPQVIPADIDDITQVDFEQPFLSKAYSRFTALLEALETKYGYVIGDVNWSGILNTAMDLRGQNLFMDMFDQPEAVKSFFAGITEVIERFVVEVKNKTGSSSISVNRNVRNLTPAINLHSECSLTMISTDDYENFLMDTDIKWSQSLQPFGIHYCGNDPHRYAESFAKIPQLDFLDLGWGGDVKLLRQYLPNTFFNIRLSPVELIAQTPDEIAMIIRTLVEDSGNPALTGICSINIDDKVADEQIAAIFETVANLRDEYSKK